MLQNCKKGDRMQVQPTTSFYSHQMEKPEEEKKHSAHILQRYPSKEKQQDLRSKNIRPIFSSYWCGGYRDEGQPIHLNHIPNYIDIVPLGFATLGKDSTIHTNEYLLKNQGEKTLKKWIQQVKKNGQKVLISIGETDSNTFADPNPKILAQNAKKLMHEWDLDGFDFYAEGRELSALKTIIPAMRLALGDKALLSYTCSGRTQEEKEILKAIHSDINWVQTMAYELEFEETTAMAAYYADIVGKEKVLIGVKVGIKICFDSTPLEDCQKLAEWVRQEGFKGMMLFSFDADTKCYTGQKEWSWAGAVDGGLGSNHAAAELSIPIKENPFNSHSLLITGLNEAKEEPEANKETTPMEVDSSTSEPQKRKNNRLSSLASRIARGFSRWCCCCK